MQKTVVSSVLFLDEKDLLAIYGGEGENTGSDEIIYYWIHGENGIIYGWEHR